jgi:hypothetical protein
LLLRTGRERRDFFCHGGGPPQSKTLDGRIVTDEKTIYPIALDANLELAREIGLLLSCYALIDLYILHIFATVSELPKDAAYAVLGRVRGNAQRIELIRDLIDASVRPAKAHELDLMKRVGEATKIRNQYAHAIYSGLAPKSPGPIFWRMSMWLSDGGKRKKEFRDTSADIARRDGLFMREVLLSLAHFGGPEVAYE